MTPFVHDGLFLAPSTVHGEGVFTRFGLARGTVVIRFGGVVRRADELAPDSRCLQIDRELYLCDSGELDDFVNHSCEPNLGFVDGSLALTALRDIAPGEQLFWDYSTSMDEPGWRFDCLCGAATCRGEVTSFRDLAPAERTRLLPLALQYLRIEALT